VQAFSTFHEKKGDKVEMVCKDTTLEEEKRLAEKVMSMPTARALSCSENVSTILSGSQAFQEVKADTFWPGNLYMYRDAGR